MIVLHLIKENEMSTKFYSDYEESGIRYDDYLSEHIENVKKSWNDILRPWLEEPENMIEFDECTIEYIDDIQRQIDKHDKSKYEKVEYEPYRNNFYPTCKADLNDYNKTQYDLAWLHHQHVNKHHPQYWVLQTDNEGTRILDMDFASICEMLCDWHSFSAKYPESTCNNWYDKVKNTYPLSDNTKETVEKLIEAFIGKSLGS